MSTIRLPVSKVALDKFLSAGLLVVTAPLSAAIAAAIIIESLVSSRARGGVFHVEVRISAGEPFKLVKFRILTAVGEGKIHAGDRPKDVENDPANLTRVGSLLKRVGLDEIPQLIHVLRGSMSLVGPRPKPFMDYEDEMRRGHVFRARLRAGLTGPSQVLKGTDPATRPWVEDEFAYMELIESGRSLEILRADLHIIRRTVAVLLRATGE